MDDLATHLEPEDAKPDTSENVSAPMPIEDFSPTEPEIPDSEEDISEDNVVEEEVAIPSIGNKTTSTLNDSPSLIAAQQCQIGRRKRNEDSCFVFTAQAGGHFKLPPFGLYVVADGMGGHANGHVASKLASRIAASHIIDQIYLPMIESDDLSNQAPVQEVLETAVQAAHRKLYDPDPNQDSGTTLTIALILGRRLYIAHVGDTRIYQLANEKFETLTTDHSLVQSLQDVGQLPSDDDSYYHIRHILLRAVGQGEKLEVDIYTRPLPKEGKLLLCTDGLCGVLTDDEMRTIVEQDLSVESITDELYEAALEAGSYDNITAILVDFKL